MSPAAHSLEPGSTFQDRYEVLGELGAGSFGRVVRARQRSTGQDVAIKVLRVREQDTPQDVENHVERLRREMRLCATLSHPHIVRLIDSGALEDGSLYAVFAYVPGRTLREVLEAEGRLEPAEAIHLMAQVLDALSCAHAAGIVHRDLKPENVMVTQTGVRRHVTVLDFGLGGFSAGVSERGQRLTGSGEMMGTFSYAAPEQLRGEPPSPRSDLYSWGLILLECLSGEPAVAGRTGYEALMRQLGPEPIPIPDWLRQQRLGRLLAAVTAKDVAQRDMSIAALLHSLESIQRSAVEVASGEERRAPAAEGERRQLTVLCCTTKLARRDGGPVDLDDLDLLMRAQQALLEGIASQGGATVVRSQAGELQVVLGYPRGRENDARRAVRLGLRMLSESRAASSRLETTQGVRVEMGLGVHSGVGIVRVLEVPPERDARCDIVGTPPVLAARLAERAAADQLLVTVDTRALLRDEFECDLAGEVELPERAGRAQVFRVLRERPASSLETFLPRQETPLVGRHGEHAHLLGQWEAARAGEPSVVLLHGEAGIGKSRLVRELRRRVTADAWLVGRCTAEGQSSPLHPILGWLQTLEVPVDRLLARLGFDLGATLPLFASLLSLPLDDRFAPLRLPPERQRELTLAAVSSLVLAMARERPLVLVFEDLHWADPTTLELVWTLVEDIRAARLSAGERRPALLALFTARPEYTPAWLGEGVSVLALGRLGRAEVAEMVAGLLPAGRHPSAELVERIALRTDGVPLFVEELGQTLGGAADPQVAAESLEVPATLRELLTARLDTLSTSAYETVQFAAALGREFPYDVLRAAVGKDDWVLRQDVMELVDARLVFGRRRAAAEGYLFKHALVRDAAYDTMMRTTRQRVHGRIAAAIAERLTTLGEQQPELLAHHLEHGGDLESASLHWQRAGERALRRASYPEAAQHLERGLAALAELPRAPERLAREIETLITLGTVFLSTGGHADPRTRDTFARARALCDEHGVEVSLKILGGLIGGFITAGEREATEALLPRMERLVAEGGDAAAMLTGVLALAVHAFWRGEQTRAQPLLDRARPLYRHEDFRRYAEEYGWDGGIYALAYSAWNLCIAGHPDRAEALCQELLETAEASFDPQAVPLALAFGMAAAHGCHDVAGARVRAERLVAMAGEQRMFLWLAIGQCGLGLALALEGGPAEGVALVQQGLELVRLSGARTVYGYYLTYLAAALAAAGRREEALGAVREGLALCERDLARVHEPELLRLEGELLVAGGQRAEGAERLRQAIACARRAEARMWELRAAVSLARLLVASGEREEGARWLRPVVGWFTEGRELPELVEARAILGGA